ncbi:MAG: DUF2914 domain-containing protein [Candidatus Delongbacteria bacterium]|nr:DUF2914 domain-containing protein [Candidatus Delongbacteria bacterium]
MVFIVAYQSLMERARGFIRRHHELLWWLHSSYALLFGIVFIWLGAKDFTYLRLAIFHIAFIWLSSLFLPTLLHLPFIRLHWHERIRLVINYFNRNFYQQLIFFLLPIYYLSATIWSRHLVFLLLLSASAVLSTMDLIYDRHISVKWGLLGLFFTFNVFVCINVMLPVLWGIPNTYALWISACLAVLAFASVCYRLSGLPRQRMWMTIMISAVLVLLITEKGRIYIPPAPLRLVRSEFGRDIIRKHKVIYQALDSISSFETGKICILTAIQAPLGMKEKVCHRWSINDSLTFVSPFYQVHGGRKEGFRLFTSMTIRRPLVGGVITVEIMTEGGQLIGKSNLPIRWMN